VNDADVVARLAEALQGRPINVIQRGPLVFVDATGPMTASTAYDLARWLLPAVREIANHGAAEELEAAGDAHPCTRGRLHQRAAALRGEAGR
jgi:hypothetical protein